MEFVFERPDPSKELRSDRVDEIISKALSRIYKEAEEQNLTRLQ